MAMTDGEIQACLWRLVSDCGPNKSICPSEVARALSASNWRELMEPVRRVGTQLAKAGHIEITQKGVVVHPDEVRGPIRYRITRSTTDQ